MRDFRTDHSGNVLLLFGLALPVLLAAGGAALDYSDLTRRRTELQKSADDAALAATKALAMSTAATPGQRESEALSVANRMLSESAAGAQRTVTPSAAENTVKVSLASEHAFRFGGILGTRSGALSVEAEATYSAPAAPCIVALGQTEDAGISLVGSAKINATRCSVWSDAPGPNSITTQGAAKIVARSVCGVGGTGKASSTPPAKGNCAPVSDPYESREVRCGKNQTMSCHDGGALAKTGGKVASAVSTYTGACDYTNVAVGASSKGTVTLSPGVYCGGLSVQSADVVLLPGFYQIQDGPLVLQGNASLTGDAVSILLSGNNAALDLQGSPKLKLSAMLTGSLAGIAISSNTPASPRLTSTLQGSPDVSLTGSLWLPGQTLKMQGSPTLTLNGATDKAVAYSFDLHGSPDLIVKADENSDRKGGFADLRLVR
ncbi:MAG TPA: pilus assembly protein TadG-related protein [Beijerinckiaceae bacterium]|jgi:Flp pilus assembly protein TadG